MTPAVRAPLSLFSLYWSSYLIIIIIIIIIVVIIIISIINTIITIPFFLFLTVSPYSVSVNIT